MSATGYTPIKIYSSSTPTNAPATGNLVNDINGSELAINIADGKLFYKDSAGVVQVLATKSTAAGLFSSITDSGNLTFTGTGNRITGDFTNATFANRVMFQTSTTNSSTGIYALPNGTSTAASWQATNNADPTNASKILIATNGSTDVQLVSGINGSGTYLPLTFWNSGAEKMRLDTAGNVGISTTPSAWGSGFTALQIGSSSLWGSTSSPVSHLSTNTYFDGANYKYLTTAAVTDYYQSAGTHVWRTAVSGTAGTNISVLNTSMLIDASGNVGIGVSAPGAKIDVAGQAYFRGAATAGAIAVINPDSTSGYNGIELAASFASSGYGPIRFTTSATERMRISSDGRVLIGQTTAPQGEALGVSSGATGWTTSIFSNVPTIGLGHLVTSAANVCYALFFQTSTNVQAGIVSCTGSTTTYGTSSDYRLKENIQPMQGALDVIAQLNPVTYKWKADGKASQGFIAHELQDVVPECVIGKKDGMRTEKYEISPSIPATLDEKGKVLSPDVEAVMGEREIPAYQCMDTSFLVATLVAAIQEQQAMIVDLKARIETLEAI